MESSTTNPVEAEGEPCAGEGNEEAAPETTAVEEFPSTPPQEVPQAPDDAPVSLDTQTEAAPGDSGKTQPTSTTPASATDSQAGDAPKPKKKVDELMIPTPEGPSRRSPSPRPKFVKVSPKKPPPEGASPASVAKAEGDDTKAAPSERGRTKSRSASVSSPASPSSTASVGSHLNTAPRASTVPSQFRKLRQTSHTIVELNSGDVYIISSLSIRDDTQVITVDPVTGALRYTGIPGVDLFKSEQDAFTFVTRGEDNLKMKMHCYALLGLVVAAGCITVVVATKIKEDMNLIESHYVSTVIESQWVKIPLQRPHTVSAAETTKLRQLTNFPIDGTHFYCETYDLTRPFPSAFSPSDHDAEFCWNDWLAKPFEKIGLRSWCVVLLQGLALSRNVTHDQTEEEVKLALVTRKSRCFPGTRYGARGINDIGGAGNDMECEIISWAVDPQTPERQSPNIRFASFNWRRGSVPVRWQTELKSAVAEPVITISPDPYRASELYWKRAQDRYGETAPIVCFNMLRCAPGNGETTLSEHFQASLKHVKKDYCPNLDAMLINFDWHHNMKQLGREKAVEGCWALMSQPLKNFDITHGTIRRGEIDVSSENGGGGGQATPTYFHVKRTHPWLMSGPKHVEAITDLHRQVGVPRYNCADSLDRTNLCTFFVAFQVVAEAMRRIGAVAKDIAQDNKWPFLSFTLPQIETVLQPSVLKCLAEFFVCNGDVCSVLYTSSPAMHTKLMRQYSPQLPKSENDTKIVLQRRYQNVTHDKVRQQIYEMFLGLYMDRYFPSLSEFQNQDQLVSSYPSAITSDVPCLFRHFNSSRLLVDTPSDPIWICQPHHHIVELFIFTREPCIVKEVGLVVRHGTSDISYPRYMDLYLGLDLDNLSPIFQDVVIPRTTDGSRLLFPCPSPSDKGILYDFDPRTSLPLTRVIRITLRDPSAGEYMTFGRVEVFGSIPLSPRFTKPYAMKCLWERKASRKISFAMLSGEDLSVCPESDDEVDHEKDPETLYREAVQTKVAGTDAKLDADNESSGKFNFFSALELELIRLTAGITPLRRDVILKSLGVSSSRIDPNAFLAHGEENRDGAPPKAPSFQKVRCHGCESDIQPGHRLTCTYCQHKFCKGCFSPDPQIILERHFQEEHPVCNTCYNVLGKQLMLLSEIRSRHAKQTVELQLTPEIPDSEDHLLHRDAKIRALLSRIRCNRSATFNERSLPSTETSLARFPEAGFLLSIPTHPDSPPPETVLCDEDTLENDTTSWFAPDGSKEAKFVIVLSAESVVTRLSLKVGADGYSDDEKFSMTISVGNTVPLYQVWGIWDLASASVSDPGLRIPGGTTLDYKFEKPAHCRIISVQFSLPADAPESSRLQVHRLEVFGKVMPPALKNELPSNEDQKLFVHAMTNGGTRKRDKINPTWTEFRMGQRVLDIGTDGTMCDGFSLVVLHGEEGIRSQVKTLRCTFFQTGQAGDVLSKTELQEFIVPRVANKTTLVFDFEKPLKGNLVTFEFLNNYGGREITPGKICLFVQS